jgi:hypothetical protein
VLSVLFLRLVGSSWWGGGAGGGKRLYKKPHLVKLFFPIFYFSGHLQGIQKFFQVGFQ